ncbi:divergent polysaccharide deacetylase family protein [Roseobacter denitrificans]|uniref:divergent polysaccharide deacetylase family protein n=1 Tax=Roseobacter denitrificans TaxID=2434 RepID=UPI0005C5BA64|nr:divergent polysaccharide deacetylase family protein [Roseobacter denitrificans]AVL52133.1 divergent polysaccharide deacetylase family protein [Roseobacter denitrificans]
MARGFIKGVVSGAGVSLTAVAVLSIMSDLPANRAQVEGAAAGDSVAAPEVIAPDAGDASAAAVRLVAPELAGPTPDTLTDLLPDTLAPAAVPQTGSIADMQAAQTPDAMSATGLQPPRAATPRTTLGQGGALQAPTAETGVSLRTAPDPNASAAEAQAAPVAQDATTAQRRDGPEVTTDIPALDMPVLVGPQGTISSDPAQPPIPDIPASTGAFDAVPEAERGSGVVAALTPPDPAAPSQDIAQQPPEVAPAPTQPVPAPVASGEIALVNPQADANVPKVGAEALQKPAPQRRAILPDDSADAQVEADQSVAAPLDVAAPENTVAAPLSIQPAPAPSTAPPLDAVALADTAALLPDTEDAPVESRSGQDVRVNQLPTLGAAPQQEGAGGPERTAQEPETAGPEAALTPFARFATGFENPDAKPLMAVVLMDTGRDLSSATVGLAALNALPFPVTFAVDALRPDAAARMKAYRDAGFEVLATVDLPAGATAADAEVNLSVALQAVPEALGVLEGVETGVQTSADAGRQVARILAQTGHGFVTQNRGLNSIQKLAAREGVPSGVVFRDLDAEGQSSLLIRRFLDQAAFRAAQEGDVIMLGRVSEETLAALMKWTLQDRASTVAMAPVSAVLAIR